MEADIIIQKGAYIELIMNRGTINLDPGLFMPITQYDPQLIGGDVFDMDNMIEGSLNKILSINQQNISGDKDFQDEISILKRSKSGINSIPYSAVISIDLSAGDIHLISQVTGNLTVNSSNIETGQTGVIAFTIDSIGGYSIASGSGTWQKYNDSPYDFPDCNLADVKYRIYYAILESSIIEYSIQAI